MKQFIWHQRRVSNINNITNLFAEAGLRTFRINCQLDLTSGWSSSTLELQSQHPLPFSTEPYYNLSLPAASTTNLKSPIHGRKTRELAITTFEWIIQGLLKKFPNSQIQLRCEFTECFRYYNSTTVSRKITWHLHGKHIGDVYCATSVNRSNWAHFTKKERLTTLSVLPFSDYFAMKTTIFAQRWRLAGKSLLAFATILWY